MPLKRPIEELLEKLWAQVNFGLESIMRTGVISIGGVAYNYTGNNSGEISQSITGLDDEVLRNMPRTKHGAKGEPYVAIDGGVEVKLGYRFYTPEEKVTASAYRAEHSGGQGGKVSSSVRKEQDEAKAKEQDLAAREVLANEAFAKTLSESTLATLKSMIIVTEFEKAQEAIKAQAATMTAEQKAALIAALGL